MKRAALLLAVCVVGYIAAKAVAGAIPDGPGGPYIAIENTSEIDQAALAKYLPNFQTAVDQFCQAWHCTGHLYLASTPARPQDWPVKLMNKSDVQNALGYHTVGPDGVPYGVIGVQTSIQYNMPWGVVLTHELFEMLADPEASAADQRLCNTDPGTGQATNCTFYAREVADPVQGEWHLLGNVRVSDFVYRSWFTPGSSGPFDAMRRTAAPFELAPRSYLMFYADGYWQQEDTFSARRDNWDRFGSMAHPGR